MWVFFVRLQVKQLLFLCVEFFLGDDAQVKQFLELAELVHGRRRRDGSCDRRTKLGAAFFDNIDG